jgi:hypothetical protein
LHSFSASQKRLARTAISVPANNNPHSGDCCEPMAAGAETTRSDGRHITLHRREAIFIREYFQKCP